MFKEKIYRTKSAKYPTPNVSFDEKDRLLIAAWAWGATDGAQKALDIIKDYYLSARTDIEATSPFPLLPDISLAANHLRIAVMLANDILAKENNADEYTTAVEIFCMGKSQKEINVVYAGGPSLFSLRPDQQATPYIQQNHLGFEFNSQTKSPLPKDFIGIKSKKNINCRSFRSSEKEKFILLQRDYSPILESHHKDLEAIEKKLVEDNKDLPFWACEFSFD